MFVIFLCYCVFSMLRFSEFLTRRHHPVAANDNEHKHNQKRMLYQVHHRVALFLASIVCIVYSEIDLDIVENYNDTDHFYDEKLDNETIAEVAVLSEYPSVYRKCPFAIEDNCECSITTEKDDVIERFSVVCSDMETTDIFPEMMNKLRTANVQSYLYTLFIYRSKVELPRADLFLNLPFRTLRVIETEVKLSFSSDDSRSPDEFRPLLGGLEESLEEAAFRNSVVPGVEKINCFMGSLSKLRRFSLTNSDVANIPKEFFCCSYLSMQQVYLNGNKFQELPDGGLSRATNIKIVMLNHNQIFIVSRLFFPSPANKLEEIHLRSNKIQTLPRDFFHEMPVLRYIDLSENLMSTLPPDVWSPTWSSLLDLYLEDNNLICDCAFKWIIAVEANLSDEFKKARFLKGKCHADAGNESFAVDDLQNYFDSYQCD